MRHVINFSSAFVGQILKGLYPTEEAMQSWIRGESPIDDPAWLIEAWMEAPRVKTQTLRQMRKRPFAVGDTCHLYCGLRTQAAYLLGIVTATKVDVFTMNAGGIFVGYKWESWESEFVATLARHDGFADGAEMRAWFDKTYLLDKQEVRGQRVSWLGSEVSMRA